MRLFHLSLTRVCERGDWFPFRENVIACVALGGRRTSECEFFSASLEIVFKTAGKREFGLRQSGHAPFPKSKSVSTRAEDIIRRSSSEHLSSIFNERNQGLHRRDNHWFRDVLSGILSGCMRMKYGYLIGSFMQAMHITCAINGTGNSEIVARLFLAEISCTIGFISKYAASRLSVTRVLCSLHCGSTQASDRRRDPESKPFS
jgi:hypothetical protein